MIIVASIIELKIWWSTFEFINEVKIKQGREIFIVKLVTKWMGYSTLAFSQIKPIDPSKKIGEMIFNTVRNNIIFDSIKI